MVLMCDNETLDNLTFAAPTSAVQKADAVIQIDGVIVVKLANGRILTSARDFHKWAYGISHDLPMREPVVKGLAKLGVISADEAAAHMAEHRKAKERREVKFAKEMVAQYGARLGILDEIERSLELRTVADGGGA